MATTQTGSRLTEAHRLNQIQLGALTETRLSRLWDQLVDIRAINPTVNLWIDAAKPVVMASSLISARLASMYLTDYLDAETGRQAVFPTAAATNPRLIGATLNIVGREGVWTAAQYRSILDAIEVARLNAVRAAQELTLRAGRETIVRAPNPLNINEAIGWRRITDFDPCKFCANLAAKNIVTRNVSGAAFKAHPGCGCTAEPVF